jgi:cell division protein FtsB
MDIRSVLGSRIFTVILAATLIFAAVLTARLLMQKKEVESEITKLQEQTEQMNKKNQEMSELAKYLNTPEFAEKEAREKLNLKKEGEYVVMLPKSINEPRNESEALVPKTNPKIWYDYFFGSH